MPSPLDGHRAACCSSSEQPCSCCGPCIPQVPSSQERFTALRAVIADEPEPLVTLTHLLRLCRDEHEALWEHANDPNCRTRVAAVLEPLAKQPPGAVLGPQVRRLLTAALEPVDDVPAVVVAHTLAEFLDDRYGHTFASSFRRRSPYQPAVGDPMPLDSPDLRTVTAMRPTSPPWRLANRLDETRRVRLAGEWAVQFRIVFDYSLADTLTGLITADTMLATCHPNRSLADFQLTRTLDGRTFPVQPGNPDRQRAEINHLIQAAVDAGASIVVLPELSVTEELARELQDWVRRPGGLRLLAAGSYHHEQHDTNGATPRRRNSAVCWVRGHDQPLIHDKHSPGDQPINEDIQPQGWPELRLYVTNDGWHIAVAICRDLLNPHAVYALAEAGANLMLVPAMSETLMPFGGPAAHLVGSRQAIVAIANNPADWSDDTTQRSSRPARALFGHPGFGQQTRFVHAPDTTPGLAVLAVNSAQLNWLPADRHRPTRHPTPGPTDLPEATSARPAWLCRLAETTTDPAPLQHRSPDPVPLRPAAVLVLLTDAPDGPRVLLTERAPDLADYPGRCAFPGGRTEPHDDGPVATALREAAEEVGLDPDSVEIVGLLPAFALPDSGHLVTPVLAWSTRPTYTSSINLAEVTAVRQIPLRDLRARASHTVTGADETPRPSSLDRAALGTMTAAIIDLLLGILTHTDQPTDTATARLIEVQAATAPPL